MVGKLTGEGNAADEGVKKIIAIFTYNQWLLSIDSSESSESESFQNIPGSQLLSDVQRFLAALQPYKSSCPLSMDVGVAVQKKNSAFQLSY